MAPPTPDPRKQRDGASRAERSGAQPSATGAADASEHSSLELRSLVHELNNMLDGALRYLALARRGVTARSPEAAEADDTTRQLDAASDGLSRMSIMLRRAMRPQSASRQGMFDPGEPLVEALIHAADSLRPLADDRRIRINVECSPRLVLTPAGPVYTLLVNAIRNSIDAIGHDGAVDVIAELQTAQGGEPEICLDIYDDGPGPRRGHEQRVFEFGYSTRPMGDGVGLALCRDIVQQLGGHITLTRREQDRPTWTTHRPGAHLCVRYPAQITGDQG
jgi:signal transduction histidine kinase